MVNADRFVYVRMAEDGALYMPYPTSGKLRSVPEGGDRDWTHSVLKLVKNGTVVVESVTYWCKGPHAKHFAPHGEDVWTWTMGCPQTAQKFMSASVALLTCYIPLSYRTKDAKLFCQANVRGTLQVPNQNHGQPPPSSRTTRRITAENKRA